MATPAVALVSAASGSVIGPSDAVVFTITSSPSLIREVVFVNYVGAGVSEAIWNGSVFSRPYARLSTREPVSGGYKYTIRRDMEWLGSVEFEVYAVNSTPEELTYNWSYVLSSGVAHVDVGVPVLPSYTVGSPADSTGYSVHDAAYMERLFGKVQEADFVEGLKAGDGYETIKACAAIFERASSAIVTNANSMFAQYAQDGAFAKGIVELYRLAPTAAAVTVKAGTIVSAKGGRYFRTTGDVSFEPSDLGPHEVAIISLFQDYQHNVDGARQAANGTVIPGEIDTIRMLIEEPKYGDPNIFVRQIQPTLGGRSPDIELLALDHNLSKSPGESADSLRYRIRNIPNNITPNAIRQLATALLDRYAVPFEYVEGHEVRLAGMYDVPAFDSPLGAYFHPDSEAPQMFPAQNWSLDSVDSWGSFHILVKQVQPILDMGGHLDDTAADAHALRSIVHPGLRGSFVPDVDSTEDHRVACYDGRDYGLDELFQSLKELLNTNKAAGIVAGIRYERP